MANSITETLAITLRPDMAMLLAMGSIGIQLSNEDLEYKGRVIIHAGGYSSKEDEQAGFRRLVEYGWTPEMAPVKSILGWASIKEVKLYSPATFAIDAPLHWYGTDLQRFEREQGWTGKPVYGYVLEKQHLLKLPIMGVGGDEHGIFWTPKTPFEAMCFKMAFDKGRESIDVEAIA